MCVWYMWYGMDVSCVHIDMCLVVWWCMWYGYEMCVCGMGVDMCVVCADVCVLSEP